VADIDSLLGPHLQTTAAEVVLWPPCSPDRILQITLSDVTVGGVRVHDELLAPPTCVDAHDKRYWSKRAGAERRDERTRNGLHHTFEPEAIPDRALVAHQACHVVRRMTT
jgi:hypothetical protein